MVHLARYTPILTRPQHFTTCHSFASAHSEFAIVGAFHSILSCLQSYDTFEQFMEAQVDKSLAYYACLNDADSVSQYISVSNG